MVFARIVAQILAQTVSVMSRAFLQAYQQAAANPNAAKQAASNASKSLKNELKKDEALKILNFERSPQNMQELLDRYNKYFNANDPAKGGSFYLQSKFYRAKEVIEKDFEDSTAAKKEDDGPSDTKEKNE